MTWELPSGELSAEVVQWRRVDRGGAAPESWWIARAHSPPESLWVP